MGRPKSVFLQPIACRGCGNKFQPKRRESKVCSKTCLSLALASDKRKYNPEQENQAIKLREHGTINPEISRITGMPIHALKDLFKAKGIRLTPQQKESALGRRWRGHEPVVNGEKRCAGCKSWLPISNFAMDNRRISGLFPYCRLCSHVRYVEVAEIIKARQKVYRQENSERCKEEDRQRYLANPERVRQRVKAWSKSHPEQRREISKKFNKRNPHLRRARAAKRRAILRQAMPPWLTLEHMAQIKEIYRTCPSGHHVDHIVPLNGENVNGLHVPWNLRHLSEHENLVKGNKLEE